MALSFHAATSLYLFTGTISMIVRERAGVYVLRVVIMFYFLFFLAMTTVLSALNCSTRPSAEICCTLGVGD